VDAARQPQGRIASRQRRPVTLERGEIRTGGERQHDIEKTTALAGRARDELGVGR
jgi:hypothetical protein